ncbi:MAG: adenylate/guanylate cyclase domain-containing protein [Candidatus Aminicenantes bacterium]|jgi:class 3 adenylate cyclase/HAMP domain-containing protein
MRPVNFTFRLKILLSLMGTIIFFLLILLVVIRSQISHQVQWMTRQAKERSHQAFDELERLYHAELMRFAQRISEKNRIPAALQEAVEEEDPQVLIDAAAYELELAQIPLAVFTDEMGQPVVTLLEGNALAEENQIQGWMHSQLKKILRENKRNTYISGYQVFNGRLYTTHGLVLTLFRKPVGSVTIGFPVNDALVQRMGKVIQAELGFWVEDKFLAATPLENIPGLKEQMTAAANVDHRVSVTINHTHWLLISEPLNPGASRVGRQVIAVSLQEYLAPFYRIETVFQLVGISVLVIAVFLGISISRGLSAPVRQLVNATRRVARGDYDFHIDVRTKDEFSSLANSFNRMTHDLLLKEQYRGILDKVVSPEIAEEMIKGKISLGGENRIVTILFADIRGFTSITEDMEPQEVIAMLNQYMERAAAAVESEGGVVDKYVGDQVMAIFGAPISQADDPLRAVRSALKINKSITQLNEIRKAKNEPVIKIGIGINTGLAVAGNMGSVKRLNYTVLGESVNIASRLCSQAGPSEILISEDTYHQVADDVKARPHKSRSIKGLSKAIKVFKVEKLKTPANDTPKPVKKSPQPLKGLMGLILLLLMVSPGNLSARQGSLPGSHLFSPGWHFVSKGGGFQVDIGGRIELSGYLPQSTPSWLIDETDPFFSGHLSLFTDIFLGSRLYGLVEFRADRGEVPSSGPLKVRIQQAFLRYTFLSSRRLHLQVGKFVSPFGDYSQRHHTAADPFIRPPLLHEYRTMICPGLAPQFNDGFIDWKDDPDRFRPIGAPIIWATPYQPGIMLFGSIGKFDFRVAAMNSAPSSDPVQWVPDFNQGWNYSLVAHLGWRISPELNLGISFDYGPYSLEIIKDMLPQGYSINDYNQIMWAVNATYTRGKIAVRMELIYDTWEVPNVIEDPVDISYYLEVKYKFLPGLFGALRYNGIYFNKIPYSNGEKEKWDYDVQRWQLGVGYAFSRRLEVRAEYMINRTIGPYDPEDNLFALQWTWRF